MLSCQSSITESINFMFVFQSESTVFPAVFLIKKKKKSTPLMLIAGVLGCVEGSFGWKSLVRTSLLQDEDNSELVGVELNSYSRTLLSSTSIYCTRKLIFLKLGI